jgi:hypothetical protein
VRPAAAKGGLRQGGRRGGGCAWWRVRRGGLQVVGEVAMSSRAAGLAGVRLKLYCHRTGREHLRMGLLRLSESSVRRRPLFTYKRRLDERSETDAADCNHSGWQITGADTVEWRLLQVTARNSLSAEEFVATAFTQISRHREAHPLISWSNLQLLLTESARQIGCIRRIDSAVQVNRGTGTPEALLNYISQHWAYTIHNS